MFFLPAASSPEKEGSLTNTQRLLQWHDKALDPPGRQPLRRLVRLSPRQAAQAALRRLDRPAATSRCSTSPGTTSATQPEQLPDGTPSRIAGEPDLEKVLQEINGYRTDEIDPRSGRPRLLSGFAELKDDGSTACGCWIYSGVYPRAGPQPRPRAQAAAGNPLAAGLGLGLARTTAGCCTTAPRPTPTAGRGRSGRSSSGGTTQAGRWVGRRRARLRRRSSRRTTVRRPARPAWTPSPATSPFIMKPDGVGWLFAPGSVQGRAAADALRAGRVAGRQPALPAADRPTRRCGTSRGRSTARPHADGGVPDRGHARSASPSTT